MTRDRSPGTNTTQVQLTQMQAQQLRGLVEAGAIKGLRVEASGADDAHTSSQQSQLQKDRSSQAEDYLGVMVEEVLLLEDPAMLLTTFEAVYRHDPDRIDEWKDWASRTLEQSVDEDLRPVLMRILDWPEGLSTDATEFGTPSPTSLASILANTPAEPSVHDKDVSRSPDDHAIAYPRQDTADTENRDACLGVRRQQRIPLSAYEHGEQCLHRFFTVSGASSCTFYLCDPSSEELRLLYMPGVVTTEPMHGPIFDIATRKRILDGLPIEYIPCVSGDWRLEDGRLKEVDELVQKNPLFGGFIHREGVKSCARATRTDPHGFRATLFINFREDRDSQTQSDLQRQVESLLDEMITILPRLGQELSAGDEAVRFRLAEIFHHLNYPGALWRIGDFTDTAEALKQYLFAVLESVLAAFDVTPDRGSGTIYIYHRQSGRLDPLVWQGLDHHPGSEWPRKGNGTASWIALKRMSLLINDIASSDFQSICARMLPHTRNIMAAPILVGDELLGVLNIESSRAAAFTPEELRTLCFAANHLSIPCLLSREVIDHREVASQTRKVLQIHHDTVAGSPEDGNPEAHGAPLDRFSRLLCTACEADLCDLWQFDEPHGEFTRCGASYEEFDRLPPLRCAGWTSEVRRRGTPIWLSNTHSLGEFEAFCWQDEKWLKIENDGSSPRDVNDRLAYLNVQCELAVPVFLRGSCQGVAWLKYRAPDTFDNKPTREMMRAVTELAGTIGLAMDSADRYAEQIQQYRKRLFAKRLETSHAQVYVDDFACEGSLGGDVYALVKSDDRPDTVFGFLADGTSHGIPAALEALPLLATFRLFSRETTSCANYILEKLNRMALDLECIATALTFLLDLSRDAPCLYSCSAGHPPLIVIDSQGHNHDIPSLGSQALTVPLGVLQNPRVAVDFMTVEPGSMIIGYTDGISEAGAAQRKPQFGRMGIMTVAMEHFKEDAETIAKAVFTRAREHAGGMLADDATVMVIKILRSDKGT